MRPEGKVKIQIRSDYGKLCDNIFYASTENEKDLDKVEKFLDETFCDCYLDRAEDSIEGEFFSKWDYPEKR